MASFIIVFAIQWLDLSCMFQWLDLSCMYIIYLQKKLDTMMATFWIHAMIVHKNYYSVYNSTIIFRKLYSTSHVTQNKLFYMYIYTYWSGCHMWNPSCVHFLAPPNYGSHLIHFYTSLLQYLVFIFKNKCFNHTH